MRSARDVMSTGVMMGALVCTSACSLVDGQPWGQLGEAGATASFTLPDERLDESARLLTAKSYAVALDIVVASFSALTLDQAAETAAAFDPAAPPAGFSLCHNGHCHADDGRLVDYEQVAIEAGAASAGASLTIGIDASPGLRQTPAALPLECEAPCTFERGTLVTASLFLDEVHVRGLAFDALDAGRLPDGGMPIDFVLAPPVPVRTPLDVEIERFQPVDWELDAAFALTPALLDAFDFEDGIEQGALDEAAFEVARSSALSVQLTPTTGDTP